MVCGTEEGRIITQTRLDTLTEGMKRHEEIVVLRSSLSNVGI